ncbi:hypothetical protein [Paenibacillus arenosi]|uniref:DUF3995 domain-containing protein n=1 Tax=Paenibacillus arenosi TaxID=2774142 RepID=A0ABR9AY04_9BACL|nr:hypothetical protein [Paenibacillus arenosi]MBD8498578.1 hypothetical protein [Paenibacillus arenosi]
MTNHNQEHSTTLFADWMQKVIPVLSVLLGGAALWYTWYMYNDNMNTLDFPWYGWIRVACIGILGIFCVTAALLLLLSKPLGWNVLKLGLSIIPFMLFSGLVIVGIRGIYYLFNNSSALFERFEQFIMDPSNLVIPIIVVALLLLGKLNQTKSK